MHNCHECGKPCGCGAGEHIIAHNECLSCDNCVFVWEIEQQALDPHKKRRDLRFKRRLMRQIDRYKWFTLICNKINTKRRMANQIEKVFGTWKKKIRKGKPRRRQYTLNK